MAKNVDLVEKSAFLGRLVQYLLLGLVPKVLWLFFTNELSISPG
jgi:hypothetical protein